MKSKQLSIISRQPKSSDFTFFLDRQTDGDDLYKVLTDAKIKVCRHKERFKDDEDDDVWIPAVAKEFLVAVSADQRMERDAIILEAICESRAKVVLLTDNASGYPQWAASLITHHDSIVRTLLSYDGPLIIRLARSGISKVRQPQDVEAKRRRVETQQILREKRGSG